MFFLQQTATASGYSVTTVVFTIPEQRVMKIDQVQRTGYGITNSPTRLVLRSPLNAPETFFQNVSPLVCTKLPKFVDGPMSSFLDVFTGSRGTNGCAQNLHHLGEYIVVYSNRFFCCLPNTRYNS